MLPSVFRTKKKIAAGDLFLVKLTTGEIFTLRQTVPAPVAAATLTYLLPLVFYHHFPSQLLP